MTNLTTRIGIAGVTVAAVGAGAVTQVAAAPSQTASRTASTSASTTAPTAQPNKLNESDKAFLDKVVRAGGELKFAGGLMIYTSTPDDEFKQKYGFTDSELERLHNTIDEYNDAQNPPIPVSPILPGRLPAAAEVGGAEAAEAAEAGVAEAGTSKRAGELSAEALASDYYRPLVAAAGEGTPTLAVVWAIYHDIDTSAGRKPLVKWLAKLPEAFFTELAGNINTAVKQNKGIAFYDRGDSTPNAETRVE